MALTAFVILLAGILLIAAGKRTRQRHGLTDAPTLDLDGRTLYSARYGLSGRPDRVIAGNIPEEWKGSPRVYESHRAQLGAYFILIEEETGIRPPYGWIVVAGGRRERIENTPELRAHVLEIANEIRAMRKNPDEPIPVKQPASKCRGCGMREACGQRSD